MLKFDHFTSGTSGLSGASLSPSFDKREGFNSEFKPVNSSSPDTYLDKYSKLMKNQRVLLMAVDDFTIHMEGLEYCNILADAKANNRRENALTHATDYTVSNKYLTNNENVKFPMADPTTSSIATACTAITNWSLNKNTPLLKIDPATTDILTFDLSNNFGQNIMTDISFINLILNTNSNLLNDISNNYTSKTTKDMPSIVSIFNENLKTRQDLDTKMMELYGNDQSIAMYQKKSLDSVVYANILWTVLATSVIYFVFVKL
jgi:hypothetical protein